MTLVKVQALQRKSKVGQKETVRLAPLHFACPEQLIKASKNRCNK